jgi:hypothetical protein
MSSRGAAATSRSQRDSSPWLRCCSSKLDHQAVARLRRALAPIEAEPLRGQPPVVPSDENREEREREETPVNIRFENVAVAIATDLEESVGVANEGKSLANKRQAH